MQDPRWKTISFQLPVEVFKEIDAIAGEYNISLAAAAAALVGDGLRSHGAKVDAWNTSNRYNLARESFYDRPA